MKKLMQVFASVMIATSTFGGVTSVAAKELHQKYANVKFKGLTSNLVTLL